MPAIQRSLFTGSVLFKFKVDDDWLRFRIRSRRSRYAHTFYCNRKAFLDWLDAGASSYLETDCGHLMKAVQFQDQLTLEFYWLNRYSDGKLTGCVDTVYLRKEELINGLTGSGLILSYDHRLDTPSQYDFSNAQSTLQHVLQTSVKRRALCKLLAVRSSDYCGDTVRLYNDGQDSFYFIATMKTGHRYNGGLILHSGTTKEGYPNVYYSVHT